MLRPAFAALLLLPLAAAAADPGRELVQQRMLGLVRDTALRSDYAYEQWTRLAANPPADAAATAAQVVRDLKHFGLKVRRSQLPGGGEQIVADWSGRSSPQEVVVIGSRFQPGGTAADRGAANLAALMGVVKVYSDLLLKPRRTIRLVISIGEGDLVATTATTVAEAARSRHVAVIDGELSGSNPRGIAAQVSQRAVPSLETLRRALADLGPTEVQGAREFPVIAALRLPGVPAFGLLEPAEPTAAIPDAKALRRQVALLATLAWWLGEMDAPLAIEPPLAS